MAEFTPTGVAFVGQNLNKYLSNLGRADKAQQKLGKSVTGMAGQFSSLGSGILKFGTVVGGAAVAGVGALATGIVALGVASVSTAISFESAFAGVIKTTEGLTDEMGNLTTAGIELRQGFVDLSKEVPLAFEELAAIGEIGGQLGIAKADLLSFTETVTALGVATNLTTEEAAVGLARFSSIFGASLEEAGVSVSENVGLLGSALVNLGNNLETNEAAILSFATRLAGAGQIAGITQAGVLGISAAFSSVGVSAEAGGTAASTALIEITNAVSAATTGFVDNTKAISANASKISSLNANLVRAEAMTGLTGSAMVQMRDEFIAAGGTVEEFGRQLGDTNRQKLLETQLAINQLTNETQLLRDAQGQPISSEKLEKFARVAGMTANDFAEAWRIDADSAFRAFVEGLAGEGDQAAATLDKLGLGSSQALQAFLKLSGAGDKLSDALILANEGIEDGNFAMREAAQRYATTESQLLILKNTIRAVGDTIGSRFLPFLNKMVAVGKDVVNDFAGPIADAIDNQVIPAIESIIALAGELFTAFQAGGVTGLSAALGITPELTELIDKIAGSVSQLGNAILSFLVPGFDALAGGGLLDIINQAIIFLNQNFEVLQGAVLGIGAVLAAGVFAALTGAVLALLTPINLIIAAAALLGAAWVGNWFDIQGIVQSVIAVITTNFGILVGVVQSVVGTITGILGILVETFTGLILPQIMMVFNNLTVALNSLGLDWADVWNAIVTATKIVAIAVGVAILGIITVFTSLISGLATGLAVATTFFSEFGAAYEAIITGVVTAWMGFIDLIQAVIAGDWAAAWEAAAQILDGNVQTIIGIFELIATGFQAVAATIIGFVAGFALSVIEIFQGLSDALVGNSIITDMVQSILDLFLALPEAILSSLSQIGSIVGDIFGAIFGGGGGEEISFDLSGLIESLSNVLSAIDKVNSALQNISLISLLALRTATMRTMESMMESFLQIMQQVLETDLTIQNIYLVTLPTLQAVTIQTTQIMITSFLSVIPAVSQLISVVRDLVSALGDAASTAGNMASTIIEGFEDAADAGEDLIDVIKDLTDEMLKLADAASALSEAGAETAAAASGIGLSRGIGLQAGTPALGAVIPPGFPNDSFGPIFVESGERMLVVPRGGPSIEELVLGSGGSGRIVNVNFGGVTISNQIDEELFMNRVRREVSEAIG